MPEETKQLAFPGMENGTGISSEEEHIPTEVEYIGRQYVLPEENKGETVRVWSISGAEYPVVMREMTEEEAKVAHSFGRATSDPQLASGILLISGGKKVRKGSTLPGERGAIILHEEEHLKRLEPPTYGGFNVSILLEELETSLLALKRAKSSLVARNLLGSIDYVLNEAEVKGYNPGRLLKEAEAHTGVIFKDFPRGRGYLITMRGMLKLAELEAIRKPDSKQADLLSTLRWFTVFRPQYMYNYMGKASRGLVDKLLSKGYLEMTDEL
jgi:hypothetical protein